MIFSSSEKRDETSIEAKSEYRFKLRVSQWFSQHAISIVQEHFVAIGVYDGVKRRISLMDEKQLNIPFSLAFIQNG